MTKTVIIAHRRRGAGYWEGYGERPEADADEWLGYFRGLGQIAKAFPTMSAFQRDCERLLDRLEKRDKRRKELTGL